MRLLNRIGVRQVGLGAVAAMAALAVNADGALAGSYPMYQCRDAAGRLSSIRTDWRFYAWPGGRLYNVCASRGDFGIMQTPSGQTGNEGQTRIAIAVPASSPHVSLARVIFRAMIAPKTGGALSHGWVTVWSDNQEVDNQPLVDGPTPWINRVDAPLGGAAPAGARSVALSVACFESCQFSPWESVQVRQAVFTLVKDVAPVVGGVGGSLLEAGARRGTQTLTSIIGSLIGLRFWGWVSGLGTCS